MLALERLVATFLVSSLLTDRLLRCGNISVLHICLYETPPFVFGLLPSMILVFERFERNEREFGKRRNVDMSAVIRIADTAVLLLSKDLKN